MNKNKLEFGWESREEKIRSYRLISPKKKLEWLAEMLAVVNNVWSKKQKALFYKTREAR